MIAAKQSEGFEELLSRDDEISKSLREMQDLYITKQGSQTQQIVGVLTSQYDDLSSQNRELLSRLDNHRLANVGSSNPPPQELSPSDNKKDMLEMIADNKLDAVRDLIGRKPALAIQALDNKERTALHVAAGSGNIDLLKSLIRKSANINAQDDDGSTPLHRAVQAKSPACVRYLLFSRADANIQDDKMKAPADYAGQANEIAWILRNGYNIEAKNKQNQTALIWFVIHQRPAVVESLLQQGASKDYCGPDEDGNTPLTIAADRGYLKVVSMLLEHGANVDFRSARQDTGLTLAAKNGHMDVVKKLLASKADINALNKMTFNAAMEATFHVQEEVAVHLIRAGASLEPINHANYTMIQLAGQVGATGALKAILERDPRQVNIKINWTPLLEASFHGHKGCVEVLLSYRANVDLRTGKQRQSPLHLAAQQGHNHIIRTLVKEGHADIEARDSETWTPLITALRSNHLDAIRELLELGADANNIELIREAWTPLNFAVESGNREAIRLLVQLGKADVNKQNADGVGYTPLMQAVKKNNLTMARDLIELGADPDIVDVDPHLDRGRHYPPLCYAAMEAGSNGLDMVKLLVEQGKANLELCNATHSWTALHEVACHGPLSAVRYLLERGADPNALAVCDFNGQRLTPLGLAEREARNKNGWGKISDVLRHGYPPSESIAEDKDPTWTEIGHDDANLS